jgi:hypothetical protein
VTLRKASNPFESLGILPPAEAPQAAASAVVEPVAAPARPGPVGVPSVAAPVIPAIVTPVVESEPAPAVVPTADIPAPDPALVRPARSTPPAPVKRAKAKQDEALPARRSERLQVNVTRRTKLLIRFEEMERQKRGLKPRERDETTLVEQAIEKAYGHLWASYSKLFTDDQS